MALLLGEFGEEEVGGMKKSQRVLERAPGAGCRRVSERAVPSICLGPVQQDGALTLSRAGPVSPYPGEKCAACFPDWDKRASLFLSCDSKE